MTMTPNEIKSAIDGLECSFNGLSSSVDKHRCGTEIHGKVRRVTKELDTAINSTTNQDDLAEYRAQRDRTRKLIDRILVEVFHFTPAAVQGLRGVPTTAVVNVPATAVVNVPAGTTSIVINIES